MKPEHPHNSSKYGWKINFPAPNGRSIFDDFVKPKCKMGKAGEEIKQLSYASVWTWASVLLY